MEGLPSGRGEGQEGGQLHQRHVFRVRIQGGGADPAQTGGDLRHLACRRSGRVDDVIVSVVVVVVVAE